jgi:hypothetical protein
MHYSTFLLMSNFYYVTIEDNQEILLDTRASSLAEGEVWEREWTIVIATHIPFQGDIFIMGDRL